MPGENTSLVEGRQVFIRSAGKRLVVNTGMMKNSAVSAKRAISMLWLLFP
jgi:hypothetical protein